MSGWPSGPKYEQFFNVFDLVPWIIESSSFMVFYKSFSWYTLKANTWNKHFMFNAHLNPIASHAMYHDPKETPEERAKNKIYPDMLKEHTKPEDHGPCSKCTVK